MTVNPCNNCNNDCLSCREYLNYSGKEYKNIAMHILNNISNKKREVMNIKLGSINA